MADVNIVRVPYKGAGPAITALMSGEIQVMIATVGSAMPYVRSGRLRALAATSAQPSALLPGLPTISGSGLPGYEASVYHAAFARANTPSAIIHRLNEEMIRVLTTSSVKDKLLSEGVEVVGSTPDELAAMVKSDRDVWGKVIRDAGIHAD
jgi:tripartite-type tricarboxylate transporter receptor subunit TctC